VSGGKETRGGWMKFRCTMPVFSLVLNYLLKAEHCKGMKEATKQLEQSK